MGTIPLALAIVGAGTSAAAPSHANQIIPGEQVTRWVRGDTPITGHYKVIDTAAETLSSLQGARPQPNTAYLAPVGQLHLPVPVAPVPPIMPPPGKVRVGDLEVTPPDWLDKRLTTQINDQSAVGEAYVATFLDSIGMERSRSDYVAARTVGDAAVGMAVGTAASAAVAVGSVALGGPGGLMTAGIALEAGPMLGAAVGGVVGAVDGITAPAHDGHRRVAPGRSVRPPNSERT
ncbi:hypothetical protein [Nocardia vaccinii]|uniref:hypothetical protein n=1 Tax=Nocardia vaccinii TaxID=1822 RepID=UPI0012F49CC9|nr:hypothetical protein [Nocardia vaccinii]